MGDEMSVKTLPSFLTSSECILQILSSLREGVFIYDLDLRVMYMNETARGLGFNFDNVIGKTIFEVFPDFDIADSGVLKVRSTGAPSKSKIENFITYKNVRMTTLTSAFPIYQDNELVGAVEVFENISAIRELSEKVLELQQKSSQQRNVKNVLTPDFYTVDSIISKNPTIQTLKNMIQKLANSPSQILIYGETGTGKELIVQAIHSAYTQKNLPFIAQNCAAIPETLLEGILFGTVKGGFTGAQDRPGLFELANEGILFLDEINSMSLSLQAKLLRILQEQKVRRVGGQKEIPVNVRLISATNVHPEVLLKSGDLRLDLYYRINVINLEVPPLRYRREDIPLLVDHFINHYNKVFEKQVQTVDSEAMNYFMHHDWPGNVRELKNMIERAMNLVEGRTILMNHLKKGTFLTVPNFGSNQTLSIKKRNKGLNEALKGLEIEYIKEMLIETKGNVSKAARRLDIPQQTLNNKIVANGLRAFVYNQKSLPKNG